MKHIVKFSGGKDSTAMLLLMLERGLPVDEIIFCDTGLEYPELYKHIAEVERYTGRKITVLQPPHTFLKAKTPENAVTAGRAAKTSVGVPVS